MHTNGFPQRRHGAASTACPWAIGLSALLLVALLVQLPAGATQWGYATTLPIPHGFPASTHEVINDVSCWARSNCVAVGTITVRENPEPVVVTEVQGRWDHAVRAMEPTDASNGYGELTGVSCRSAGNCVSVGDYVAAGDNTTGMSVDEVGGTWLRGTVLPVPANSDKAFFVTLPASVSCPTASSCVAVGAYQTGGVLKGFLDTDASGTWSSVEAQAPANGNPAGSVLLRSVGCGASGDCEAVGSYVNNIGTTPIGLWESGGLWHKGVSVSVPSNGSGGSLNAVACPTPSTCIAVGAYGITVGSQLAGLTDAAVSGVWGVPGEAVPPKNAFPFQLTTLSALACATATTCVAGGQYTLNDVSFAHRDGGQTGVVLSETGGAWSRGVEANLPQNAVEVASQIAQIAAVSCTAAASKPCVVVGDYFATTGNAAFASTPATPPGAPGITRVVDLVHGFDVTVRPPSSNGGLRIATYQYSLDGGRTWRTRSSGTNSTTLVLGGLAAHRTYRLAVRAVTFAGIGPASPVRRSTTA